MLTLPGMEDPNRKERDFIILCGCCELQNFRTVNYREKLILFINVILINRSEKVKRCITSTNGISTQLSHQ